MEKKITIRVAIQFKNALQGILKENLLLWGQEGL